jgi:hypothetical protein
MNCGYILYFLYTYPAIEPFLIKSEIEFLYLSKIASEVMSCLLVSRTV